MTLLDAGPPGSARPTGTVTSLFSDIEGSTQLWERDHEAMKLALARHDALMRAAIEANVAYVMRRDWSATSIYNTENSGTSVSPRSGGVTRNS